LSFTAGAQQGEQVRRIGVLWEESHGMVQAENIDSGIRNFQLDNRFGRDHHCLAHLSKFALTRHDQS
jgi:hypothetical protein